MIYIVTAMYAEAHALINRFQLKKDISHTRFQVFLNREADICLFISGTGLVPAAAAVSSICTEYGAGQGDFLLNIGICGQIWNKNGQVERNDCQTGRIFLCSKIRELSAGKTFYPDILYRHGFDEAQIITGQKPYDKSAPAQMEGTDFFLYDMEAAAVYQAGAYYFGPHQMSFLKVVSDDGNAADVTPEQIEKLIDNNRERLADYIARLKDIGCGEHQDGFMEDAEKKAAYEKLCADMHCSRTMRESLRQYLCYHALSGADCAPILEEMYREGKLPCTDKREGKQCFEELKKRLL